MAVAHDQISSRAAKRQNHEQAARMAVVAYRQFGQALVSYLRANVRCDEDAQDLAQEVYLRIARHPDVSGIQSLKAFAFTIAKNLLRDKSRRCATRLSASSISYDDLAMASATNDPLKQIEADERIDRINNIVAQLRPACREAYMLSRTDGLSYAAIAEHMGISISMVEKHISAVLRALRSDGNVH